MNVLEIPLFLSVTYYICYLQWKQCIPYCFFSMHWSKRLKFPKYTGDQLPSLTMIMFIWVTDFCLLLRSYRHYFIYITVAKITRSCHYKRSLFIFFFIFDVVYCFIYLYFLVCMVYECFSQMLFRWHIALS